MNNELTQSELLKAANSNDESPYLVWNNTTRAELVAHLEEQKELKVKTGDQEPSLGADFEYTQLRGMLKVGRTCMCWTDELA